MIKRLPIIPSLTVCLLLMVWHCSGPSEPNSISSVLPRDLTPTEAQLVESTDKFGLKFFQEIVEQQKDENIFISPLSVSMALGMTANGAAGTTLEAMRGALELSHLTEEESNKAYQSLIELLTSADPKVQFDIANSIWYRQGYGFEQDFYQRCQDYFNARVEGLDFNDPASADVINAWAEENTNGLIDQIISADELAAAIMALVNALYFKGAWTYEFDPEDTRSDEFTLLDGSKVACQMMEQENDFEYLETDHFQAVDLPYGDGLFSMTILLPTPDFHVDSLVALLTPENWQAWINGFETSSGLLQLPKFTLEYDILLNEVLEALGMGEAFTGSADFTRMLAGGGIWIDFVRHKTFVKVNEEGTEAAAVTIVVMTDSLPEPLLRVDRPFVFVIRERTSGALLFMGKIVKPEWEE
ncbi:MAG: serpin family protein [Fidelibacterota bacterium]|nr:MAG: serpin family protein [Candidatus Neomarinimicrobiota bacterium]